jgi:hypothetical protein
MVPVVAFRAAGRSHTLFNQAENLERWWEQNQRKILKQLDYYVNIKWQIERVEVILKQVRGKKHALDCEGEVDIGKPHVISLFIGKKIRWTPNNLLVFVHELVHCATLSAKDSRFGEPGIFEDWIFDEIATDLFAQHIMKGAGIKLRPNPLGSIEYAFLDVARKIIRSRQYRDERMKLISEIKRKLLHYLRCTNKNYYSFRKALKGV